MISQSRKSRTIAAGALALALAACGEDSDGFLAEANVCQPAFGTYQEDPAIDAVETRLPIVGTGAEERGALAQKTESTTVAIERWGLELRLSSATGATDALFLELLTGVSGADETNGDASPTVLPDGNFGKQRIVTQVVRQPVTVTAGEWIQVRFKELLPMVAGEYAWIVLTRSTAEAPGDVSWNIAPGGSGMMEKARSSFEYVPRLDQYARYRFINCK